MTQPNLGMKPSLPDHWQTLNPLGQWAGNKIKLKQYLKKNHPEDNW